MTHQNTLHLFRTFLCLIAHPLFHTCILRPTFFVVQKIFHQWTMYIVVLSETEMFFGPLNSNFRLLLSGFSDYVSFHRVDGVYLSGQALEINPFFGFTKEKGK